MMRKNESEKVIQIIKRKGILRPLDLKVYGINRKILTRLVDQGVFIRVGRGLYRLAGMEYQTPFHQYAEFNKRFPNSVICLLSALAYHEMTTQAPFEIWVGIEEKARYPGTGRVPVRVVRFSKRALREGVEKYPIESVPVKITNPARTVADCFKYRNKIGLDVAIEALKEGLMDRRFTMDEIWKYAKLCRVNNVMRPYLESMV